MASSGSLVALPSALSAQPSGIGSSRCRRRLGEGQQARIEDIAIEVDDLDSTLEALGALGIRPDAPPREVLGAVTFWTAAETSDGVRYQFVQKRGSAG